MAGQPAARPALGRVARCRAQDPVHGGDALSGSGTSGPHLGRRRPVVLLAVLTLVLLTGLTAVAVALRERDGQRPSSSPGRAAPSAPPSSTTAGSGELAPARPAASFTDSVGTNVHWDFLDTPYATRYDEVRGLLVDSGIPHVRGEVSRAADLAARGVRTTVLVDQDVDGEGDPAAIVEQLAPLAESGAVVAVEGPNEGDLFWVDRGRTYDGAPFPEGVLAWQEDLWEAVRGDPRTADLTVIGPSLGGTYWGGGNPFPPGSLEAVSDWGNIHPYAAGNPYADRFAYGGIEEYYDNADFPSVALDRYPITLETYAPPFGDRPMAATEAGWSTWRLGQSERTQAAYLPRLHLECFRLGLQRCYAYEFVDEFVDQAGQDREAHFGLLRQDLTPKPAYRAVQSLLRTVRAGGPDVGDATGALDASLDVAAPTGYDAETVHHVALARADGSVVVALWQEVSGNDLSGLDEEPPQPVREVPQPAVPVALDLGERAEGATVQEIDEDGVLVPAAAEQDASTWTFAVPDRVVLVTVPPVAT